VSRKSPPDRRTNLSRDTKTSAPIPINDPKRAFEELRDETEEAIRRVFESGGYIQGPEVDALEKEIADYMEVPHAVAVSSGTEALLLALTELEIAPGDEVIVPAFTFVASGTTAARLGAKLVFADIDPVTFQMDPTALAAAITPKTRAVVVVHLYGYPGPIHEYRRIAGDIPIIEDAAQAIGTRYFDVNRQQLKHAGSECEWGCFSFYPTKNLPACGEAGLMITNDEQRATRARQIRNHGMDALYRHALLGGNARMDGVQAAVLRVRLPHIESWNNRRRDNAALYNRLFTESGLTTRLEGFQLPATVPAGEVTNYHQYTLRVPQRDALHTNLQERGIATGVYYPIPLPRQPVFRHLGYSETDFPHSERCSEDVLSLPIHQFISVTEVERVAKSIVEFYA